MKGMSRKDYLPFAEDWDEGEGGAEKEGRVAGADEGTSSSLEDLSPKTKLATSHHSLDVVDLPMYGKNPSAAF